MTSELLEFQFNTRSHYPNRQLLTPFQNNAYGMKGRTWIEKKAWYDPEVYGRDQNKLGGISFDTKLSINSSGIWNHRNSLRLGWHPHNMYNWFTMYLFLHINGRPFKPKDWGVLRIGNVEGDNVFDWKIQALQGVVAGSIEQHGQLKQKGFEHQFVPGSGRVLGLYHGGNSLPLSAYSIHQFTELLIPTTL